MLRRDFGSGELAVAVDVELLEKCIGVSLAVGGQGL